MPRKPSPQPDDDFLSNDFLKRLENQFPVAKDARPSETIEWHEVEELDVNPFQPRESYDEGKLEEMVQSLNHFGMLQAALARPHPTREGRLQLIIGHRRREAIRRGANAGPLGAPDRERYIGKMPVRVVANVPDVAMLTLALEENEARHDLNPIERAKSYLQLKEMVAEGFGDRPATWTDVEKVTGLSYRHMKRLSDLLELPATAIDRIRQGEWTERHGRAILSLGDAPKLRDQLVRQMVKENLSARAADQRAKELRPAQKKDGEKKAGKTSKSKEDESGSVGTGAGVTTSNASAPDESSDVLVNTPSGATLDTTPSTNSQGFDESPLARRLGAALGHVREALSEIGVEKFERQNAIFGMLEEAESQLNDALSDETNIALVSAPQKQIQ